MTTLKALQQVQDIYKKAIEQQLQTELWFLRKNPWPEFVLFPRIRGLEQFWKFRKYKREEFKEWFNMRPSWLGGRGPYSEL